MADNLSGQPSEVPEYNGPQIHMMDDGCYTCNIDPSSYLDGVAKGLICKSCGQSLSGHQIYVIKDDVNIVCERCDNDNVYIGSGSFVYKVFS